jgi:hypothetical protein
MRDKSFISESLIDNSEYARFIVRTIHHIRTFLEGAELVYCGKCLIHKIKNIHVLSRRQAFMFVSITYEWENCFEFHTWAWCYRSDDSIIGVMILFYLLLNTLSRQPKSGCTPDLVLNELVTTVHSTKNLGLTLSRWKVVNNRKWSWNLERRTLAVRVCQVY